MATKNHYIGNAFSILCGNFEASLVIVIDCAPLLLSESNQFIVYTHIIDLSLISSLLTKIGQNPRFWPEYEVHIFGAMVFNDAMAYN